MGWFWVVRVIALEFCRDLWHRKTRVPGLSYGVVCMTLCVIQCRLMTDRRTDGQTHDDSIIAYTALA